MAPVRLLQVGMGPHGRSWARHVLPATTEVDVVGYVDKDPYALDLLRQESGVSAAVCFESLKEAIEATEAEALLNTTALPGHVPVTKAALEAGLHVLVEKPFASRLDEARTLVDTAALRRLTLMVSQNYRFFPAPRAIAAMVLESDLGRLHEVSIDFRRYSNSQLTAYRRHYSEEQPLLVDMSVHHFDLLRLTLGREPRRVFCEAWNPDWTSFAGPSVAVASIVFDGGVVVSYRASWISAGPITPWAGEWRMEFENGEVTWTSDADSDPTQDRVVVRPRQGEERTLMLPAMARTGSPGVLAEFVSAIRTGREPEASGHDNLGTVALMEAAVESATRQETVTVRATGEATGAAAAF